MQDLSPQLILQQIINLNKEAERNRTCQIIVSYIQRAKFPRFCKAPDFSTHFLVRSHKRPIWIIWIIIQRNTLLFPRFSNGMMICVLREFTTISIEFFSFGFIINLFYTSGLNWSIRIDGLSLATAEKKLVNSFSVEELKNMREFKLRVE